MDDLFQYNDPAKGVIEVQMVEGWVLPQPLIDMLKNGRTLKQHIDCVQELTLMDDDVIVCAFAKSGGYNV